MSISETRWPLRKIIWGIWSIEFDSFVTRGFVEKRTPRDEFDSYSEAEQYMKMVWTPREIAKWKLFPKPKERLGQNEITLEDV